MDTPPQSFTIGKFTCTLVSDGSYAYPHPAHTFFCNAPPLALAEALYHHKIDPQYWDAYVSPYSSLLIDTGEARVLVDTGAGPFGPTTGKLMSSLQRIGLAPEAIDTVILTHGHIDHIGGNLNAEGKPAFPNARYVMAQAEWDFWASDPDLAQLSCPEAIKQILREGVKANLMPLQEQIVLLKTEAETEAETGVETEIEPGIEIVPGIRALAAPGHTPGHIALSITSEGEQLLYLVDTVIHPIHIEHPSWYSVVDFDPAQVVATRQRLLQRAVDEKALVLVYHFPAPGLGYLLPQGAGWQWQPVPITQGLTQS